MDLFMTLLVIVLGFAVVGTGIFLYIKVRPRFPSLVNCWFCNTNTKIPYEKRNEWTCPFCEQYNGFSSDGDYNKPIPAQHDFHMNRLVPATNAHNYKKLVASKFCRSCTINQQLKIQQLASFVPIDEDNFDEEIEQYRVHLERAYALCPSCEGVLKDTLTRQKAWLLRLQAKEKCNSYLKGNQVYGRLLAAARSTVQLARALSASICIIMLASASASEEYLQIPPSLVALSFLPHPLPASESLREWLIFCHRSITLVVAGMLFQVIAAMSAGKTWYLRDVCGIAGWAFLLLQYLAALHLPLKDYIRMEDADCLHVVTLLATLTLSLLPFLMPTVSKSTLKKIQSDSFKRLDTTVHTASEEQAKGVSENLNEKNNMKSNKASSHIANKCSPEINIGKKICDETIFHFGDTRRDYKRSPNDVFANTSNSSGPYNRFNRAKCYSTDPYFEQDLHHSLCSLSLGTSTRPRSKRWAFESRVYGVKEFPGLFTANDSRPRPLLSPPRLGVHRNVTRSPWSAGGYWQTPTSFVAGHDGSPLSRSSSRSSGFGSLSSRPAAVAASPPGSRAGSVCAGDADRFSVHSLPAYPPNFPPTYFPFYGGPYLMPHLGSYAMAPPCYFAPPPPPPASASPQSSPALSDSDSSCASQKGTKHMDAHKGLIDILKENCWLSFIIGSSLLLNAAATVFFIFMNRNFLTGVP
ncbi:uncharacterized protein LOC126175497 [Schistocerca cancellata]|uniref:uncharacterized protein LOC126175497 n=1 Tax=Schistocerca cancellata TaxID=274614 RepID=UPI0021187E46|nr:uncharacterized protein LOC126175497 [Schistocerca cancellata]